MEGASITERRELDLRALAPQLLFIFLVLGIPVGVCIAGTIFRDGDVSWQLAAGNWILQHRSIPSTDPFSFTAAGHPWIATEWLAEIIYAIGFQLDGYGGVATLVAASLIILNAIVFFYLQRRTSPMVFSPALLAMNLVLGRFILARPHVFAWALLAAWTLLLLRSAEKGRPPSLWSAVLLVIWTNIHPSFPLAPIVAGGIGLDALIETKWATLGDWLIFGGVSAGALMLNANGLAGVVQPIRISLLSSLSAIGEWRATSPTNSPIFFWLFILGLGLILWSRIKIPLGRLLLLLTLLALSFSHVRHQASFAIVAACIVPTLWRSQPDRHQVQQWFLIAAIPFLAYSVLKPITPPESNANPWHLIRAIPPQLRNEPVLNEYSFGGPLILAGIKPYIDGRAEMYGDDFVKNYTDIADGNMQAFDLAVKRYGIRWIMWPTISKKLPNALDRSGEWRRIYADRIGLIYVKLH